jgi:hypothetical protein
MPVRRSAVAGLSSALVLAAGLLPVRAQDLAPTRESGQTVTPVFEGWYRNPDGTFSLSFGYYNRNSKEQIDVPVGPNNFVRPAPMNRGQPTHFEPRRHWGVFAVTVPANFGEEQKITWTLIFRGDTVAIPGSLKRGWEIDAIVGEADTGNKPPELRFAPDDKPGAGPRGITATKTLTASVGKAIEVTVYATDDGKASSGISTDGREGVPVRLTWFKHQGPGDVSFSNASPTPDRATGKATTMATFSAPGVYMLRVRANDASGVTGHAQCCWSNGFVRVTVSQ